MDEQEKMDMETIGGLLNEVKAKDARIKKLEARLQAAENFIHLSPCDPDMTTEQWNAYHRWLALGGKQ